MAGGSIGRTRPITNSRVLVHVSRKLRCRNPGVIVWCFFHLQWRERLERERPRPANCAVNRSRIRALTAVLLVAPQLAVNCRRSSAGSFAARRLQKAASTIIDESAMSPRPASPASGTRAQAFQQAYRYVVL